MSLLYFFSYAASGSMFRLLSTKTEEIFVKIYRVKKSSESLPFTKAFDRHASCMLCVVVNLVLSLNCFVAFQ